jgi:hypothetical protein
MNDKRSINCWKTIYHFIEVLFYGSFLVASWDFEMECFLEREGRGRERKTETKKVREKREFSKKEKSNFFVTHPMSKSNQSAH